MDEPRVWANIDVRIENYEEIVRKLNYGLSNGFMVCGIKINNILITKNAKSKDVLVFCLDTEGQLNKDTVLFSIKNKNLSPFRLYKALREKILRFAQQERRDQKALDRIFGQGNWE